MLERCPGLRGLVHEVPRCADAALARWLRHARALLFPSFAEGYGIPLVEALSVGTPVIASDLPVFRELAGTIPDYLDPLDGPGWRRAILDYARAEDDGRAATPGARAAQLARLQGWRAPTWAQHFAQVEAFMARLAGEG
jgi:glycosyltransferase involved in cell wall biosynthesis